MVNETSNGRVDVVFEENEYVLMFLGRSQSAWVLSRDLFCTTSLCQRQVNSIVIG